MEIKNIEISEGINNKVVHAEINYPRNSEKDTIEIGLGDVRASDEIRVKYNFERDGWVIYQPRQYHPQLEDGTYDLEVEWIESAFCPAWRYDLDQSQKFTYKPD